MRNRYFLLADIPLIWIAALMAFVLRFDLRFSAYSDQFFMFASVASVIKLVVFYTAGIYGRFWRYASIPDLVTLLIATTAASITILITLIVALWVGFVPEFSRAVVFNDWLLTLVLVGGLRGSARLLGESQRGIRSSRGR